VRIHAGIFVASVAIALAAGAERMIEEYYFPGEHRAWRLLVVFFLSMSILLPVVYAFRTGQIGRDRKE